jgi:dienelactone hydrolase
MKRVLLGVVVLMIALSASAFGYLLSGQYDAMWSMEYELVDTSFGYVSDKGSSVGVIVYGGGKVDSRSYAYLTQLDANVFLVDFPFRLAVFDINKGNEVMQAHPHIKQWIVVGHSLGGSMGYLYANQALQPVAGIVYLAAYPTGPNTMPTLALFGTADGLIQASDHEALFSPLEFVLIEGANHAQFGEYGHQSGDQAAQLSGAAQRAIVIAHITAFIESLQT